MYLVMEVVSTEETMNVNRKVVVVVEHPKNQKTLWGSWMILLL